MKLIKHLFFLIIPGLSLNVCAQYKFSGIIDTTAWHNDVYLSIIEDYRHTSGVYPEQIIAKTKADDKGIFTFTGDNLSDNNRIYKIHVDNCRDSDTASSHFNGHCNNSKQILFIARNLDTVFFPISFNNEMFCEVASNNAQTNSLIKTDSLLEEMRFAYAAYQSEANKRLNNKKWFNTLQDFGVQQRDPLAELYIYSFLSDRKNDTHKYYIRDLKENPYYTDLLNRLKNRYPNTDYTHQYETELAADKYMLSSTSGTGFKWTPFLIALLSGSLLANVYLLIRSKKEKREKDAHLINTLSSQEQKVLSLILNNKTNKEIASEIFVSLSTVKTHINNIYKKLGVQSREEVKSLIHKP
ncbi:LuxR C-terminal-related transcriptional regulator [Zhouia spongiae]|uniref:LuxR C-terminal-related transcriptional regulator n=1 Tax=Zhouia spongiae TaxID=2202721 RepID=A0ABY3YUY7_9FLAO|nr:helix-turn-helix transcriptional regulator [Zhouia spongiae]UNZ00249.1 LuxR C-terminal-related transcriptional regulator [Zhouia spongiae]